MDLNAVDDPQLSKEAEVVESIARETEIERAQQRTRQEQRKPNEQTEYSYFVITLND